MQEFLEVIDLLARQFYLLHLLLFEVSREHGLKHGGPRSQHLTIRNSFIYYIFGCRFKFICTEKPVIYDHYFGRPHGLQQWWIQGAHLTNTPRVPILSFWHTILMKHSHVRGWRPPPYEVGTPLWEILDPPQCKATF